MRLDSVPIAPALASRSDSARGTASGVSKAQGLAQEIRTAIIEGGLQPGDAFQREADLVTQSGLSRATVREAIRILDAEGLVEVRTGRGGGLFVGDPGSRGVGDALALTLIFGSVTAGTLVEFRRLVEPEVAALAAERATAPQLRMMHSTLVAPDWEEELDFHLHVADASGNELLRLLLRSVHTGMVRQARARLGSALHPNLDRLRDGLRGIYGAIEDGDRLRAARCMRAHIEGIEDSLRRLNLLEGRVVFGGRSPTPTAVSGSPVTDPTKAAALADEIRLMIVEEGLLPGDPLPSEREWLGRSGLARATVREAIRILSAEGLVCSRRGRTGGLVVGQPDPNRIARLLASHLTMHSVTAGALVEFRQVLEPIAAALAAERAGEEQLDALREAAQTLSPHADLDFHLRLADAAGNEVLLQLLRAVRIASRPEVLQHRFGMTRRDMETVARSHRNIYQAVAAHDSGDARTLMQRHLDRLGDVLRWSGRATETLAVQTAIDVPVPPQSGDAGAARTIGSRA